MKIYKDDNPLDSFLSEFAYNITSTERMPVCEFAKEVLFNGSEKFQLFPTQKAILKSFYNEPLTDEERLILQGWKDEDRTSWVEDRHYISLVLEAGRRASKAVSLNSLIATPKGYKLYRDIHPGDYVFTPKGKATKVLEETEVFTDRKCYKLTFQNGESVECSADHEWKTWDKKARKAYGRAKNPTKHPKIRTTQEIVDTLYIKRKDGKLENNHSIELTEPLQYPKQELLIHPYCLGLWLGDGSYKTSMITSSKEDIEFVRTKFKSLNYDTELIESQYVYRFKSNRLHKELKELGLLNKKDKLIPNNYLIGSVEQRLELLRGLMDSDGHVDKKGKAYFTNTNTNLSDLVYRLALSLGCSASKTYNTGKYKKGRQEVICKDYVQVSLRPLLTPVSIPRKAERYKPCSCQNNKRFIVKAEEIKSIPVKCITVADPEHLFLIGEELIPTHNCNAEFATINTTVGNITYGELHTKLSEGEKIGIQTYDFKKKKLYLTYDIKTELNEVEEVFEVITETGKKEITNLNHPYYKWYDDTQHCNWVELRQLQVGNNIAVSNSIDIWGTKELTNALLKYSALVLSLLKKEECYAFKNITKKEVKVLFEHNQSVFVSSNYLKLKEGVYETLLDYTLLNSLTRESTIELLTHFCELAYHVNSPTRGISFICKNSNRSFIRSLFNKLGMDTTLDSRGIKVSDPDSIIELVNIVGWDFSKDEVVLRKRIGKQGLNIDYVSSKDISRDTFGHKNIHFERIQSIKSKGVCQTIALEVEKTHVIANEIVSHNSTMSSIICLKEFYDLITLDSPAEHYGMFSGSPIAILVLAQSKAQVKDTIFSAIRGYAQGSLYFKNMEKRGDIQILSEEIRCPSKNVAIYAKHTRTEALVGYTIKCLILDEVARFQSVGEDGRNKAFEIWKNVSEGGVGFKEHFKKVAISSAWEPGDPIEVLYEEGKKSSLSLGFKLTTFQINLDLVKGVTPSIVLAYETDFVKARREFEGIRFNKFNSFIDKVRLEKSSKGTSCLDATPIPIDIGEGEQVRKYAGIQINRLAKQTNPEELSFIHVDPALKKDSAGLAIATPVKTEDDTKWKIRLDGFIKWEPHTDENGFKRIVSFLNIEDILQQIIKKRNIRRVTMDQYNSVSLTQKLHSIGIDSEIVSCTREAQFSYYMLFRDLLNHDYIILPRDSMWTAEVITELSELVLKPNKQIIHPYAAKDMADAVVNAVWQAHQYMLRSGMQMNYGMGATVAKSGILPKITLTNTANLKIGSARDKLYKNILK